MELHFLGGAREVGRSTVMATSGQLRVLFDCGVKTGKQPQFPLLEDAKRPHAVALSHAHLDHSGYIPALFRHQALPVVCTFPTIPLTDILLEDTIKIAAQDRKPAYFSRADLKKMQRHAVAVPYGKEYEFFNGDSVTLIDAGHILGSAQILFKTRDASVLYTGDFNKVKTATQPPAAVPKERVDVLVTESTYGSEDHPDRKTLVKRFCKEVKDALAQGKAALLPCFAVGRTQELLQILFENGLADRLYLDGMGRATSEVARSFPSYMRDCQTFDKALCKAKAVEDSTGRKSAAKAGNIIVTTAGMMEGGPVLNYLERFVKTGTKAKVFLTGYQVPGTNGRRLLEEGKVYSNGRTLEFPGEVSFYDFSAHCGRKELIQHAKDVNPAKILCMHGDEGKIDAFVASLRAEGFDASAPALGERITI
ncbi:MAG: MBL fold metallo-hydrolase [Candidatus Micrarchaeota archaeon]